MASQIAMASGSFGPFSLSGRAALVTGASRGLGRVFAEILCAAGASVAVAARSRDRVDSVAKELTDAGMHAVGVVMDVTREETIEPALQEAQAALGPLSILINNAGIAVTRPAIEMDHADWDHVLATNLRGPWLVAQAFARCWIAERNRGSGVGSVPDASADARAETTGQTPPTQPIGSNPVQDGPVAVAPRTASIVNIASILGHRVMPGVASYTVSKAAMLQLTRQLAAEWARYGVRVNALAPGYFETDMNTDQLSGPFGETLRKRIPMRRFGEGSDLTGPLLLLASDAGAYLTGATLDLDGGLSVLA